VFRTEHPREVAQFILAGLQFIVHRRVGPENTDQCMRRVAALPSIAESLLGAAPGSLGFLLSAWETVPWEQREGA
jgi:hypothetical protein